MILEWEFDVYDREGFSRATLEDAELEGTSNVSNGEDISNPSISMGKPKSCPPPRSFP